MWNPRRREDKKEEEEEEPEKKISRDHIILYLHSFREMRMVHTIVSIITIIIITKTSRLCETMTRPCALFARNNFVRRYRLTYYIQTYYYIYAPLIQFTQYGNNSNDTHVYKIMPGYIMTVIILFLLLHTEPCPSNRWALYVELWVYNIKHTRSVLLQV